VWFNFNCCSLDATCDDGSLGRLVNDEHKKPNCVMKLVEVDNSPHLCLFALQDLHAGSELRYNYGEGNFYWRKQVIIGCSLEFVAGGKLRYTF